MLILLQFVGGLIIANHKMPGPNIEQRTSSQLEKNSDLQTIAKEYIFVKSKRLAKMVALDTTYNLFRI